MAWTDDEYDEYDEYNDTGNPEYLDELENYQSNNVWNPEGTTWNENDVNSEPYGAIDNTEDYGNNIEQALSDWYSKQEESKIPKASSYGSTGYRLSNYGTAKNIVSTPNVMSASGTYTANRLPTFNAPTFTSPTRDQSKISSLAQKYGAADMSGLRNETQAAIASAYGKPLAVANMTLRNALAGYGKGASNIMSGARKTAENEYNQEYQNEYNQAMANYNAALQAEQNRYRAELDRVWKMAKGE